MLNRWLENGKRTKGNADLCGHIRCIPKPQYYRSPEGHPAL